MKTDRDSLLELARSGEWPEAAPESQIVPDRDDAKFERAGDVLDRFLQLRPGDSLLDFGCGEGHVTVEAHRRGCAALGYDPVSQGWDRHPEPARLCTELRQAVAAGPFNHILLYDVLDHIPLHTQPELLRELAGLLTPSGQIYLRLHPFVAAHGTHLYSSLNLAYVHLVLPQEDVWSLGGRPAQVCRVTRPLDVYQSWFREAGLRPASEEVTRGYIPSLFHDPDMVKLIATNNYKAGLAGGAKVGNKEVLHNFLSIQFVDYRLVSK